MTKDEIIKLAHKAGCYDEAHSGSLWTEKLLCFARLLENEWHKDNDALTASYMAGYFDGRKDAEVSQ